MAKAKKLLPPTIPRIHLTATRPKAEVRESSLLLMRLKELDEEFLRQTKHLAKVTKDFTKKLTDKL